jgi:hypothetical protein
VKAGVLWYYWSNEDGSYGSNWDPPRTLLTALAVGGFDQSSNTQTLLQQTLNPKEMGMHMYLRA